MPMPGYQKPLMILPHSHLPISCSEISPYSTRRQSSHLHQKYNFRKTTRKTLEIFDLDGVSMAIHIIHMIVMIKKPVRNPMSYIFLVLVVCNLHDATDATENPDSAFLFRIC